MPNRTVSSLSASQQPVIINSDLVFCLSGTSASNLVITKYQYSTNTSSNVSIPMYTNYQSLQGALNAPNGHYVLIAKSTGYSNSGSSDLFTYGPQTNWVLQMTKRYSDFILPSVMIEQIGSYGSINSSVVVKSRYSDWWYRFDGNTPYTVGSNIAGAYTRERIPAGNRAAMVTRTVSNPAKLEFYNGSTTLQKSTNGLTITKAFRRNWIENGNVKTLLLDFSQADVVSVDSLQSGSILCAVQLRNGETMKEFVSRKDSFNIPLGITVNRNGRKISSFNHSNWKTLSSQNLGNIQSGDIITFAAVGKPDKLEGFEEISIVEGSLKKEGDLKNEELIPTEKNISVYPNPFNPTTTFRVSLPQAGYARLAVYNMLGQKVATIVDGEMSAGYNDIRFDGSALSSGMYLYRLEMEKYVRSGKILLMK